MGNCGRHPASTLIDYTSFHTSQLRKPGFPHYGLLCCMRTCCVFPASRRECAQPAVWIWLGEAPKSVKQLWPGKQGSTFMHKSQQTTGPAGATCLDFCAFMAKHSMLHFIGNVKNRRMTFQQFRIETKSPNLGTQLPSGWGGYPLVMTNSLRTW
jgi:hypothetical protein